MKNKKIFSCIAVAMFFSTVLLLACGRVDDEHEASRKSRSSKSSGSSGSSESSGMFGFLRSSDAAEPVESTEIPEDTYEYDGHHYAVYEDCDTWEEAREMCESLGGHLAVINNEEENAALYEYIKECGYQSAYFGFYLDVSDTKDDSAEAAELWKWVCKNKNTYTNWRSTEPNRENPNEIYAMFYWKFEDGTWNDGDFGNNTNGGGKAYICEWDY